MRFYHLLSPLVIGMALIVAPAPASAESAPPQPHPRMQRPAATAQPATKCSQAKSKRERVCIRAWSGKEAARRARQDRKQNPGLFDASEVRRAANREPAEPAECGFGSPWTFNPDPDRVTSCSEVWWELTTEERHDDGTVDITGSLNLNTRQWNRYDYRTNPTWSQFLRIKVHNGEGALADGSPATVRSLCATGTRPCRMLHVPSEIQVNLAPGSVHHNEEGWYTEAVGIAEEVDEDNVVDLLGLGLQFVSNGTDGVPPWNFIDDNLWGRCDNALPGLASIVGPGCVNPFFTPTLSLERRLYGAAADMMAWAQRNLAGKWGWKDQGPPLYRLAAQDLRDTNRRVLCGPSSGFVQDPGLNNDLLPYPRGPSDQRPQVDSCDEFPFAGSYESGAMKTDVNGDPKPHVTSGAQCAQVIAYKNGSTGDTAIDFPKVRTLEEPTGFEPCVRGHIPSRLNSLVGTAYSTEINRSRLLDLDPFWVSVWGASVR